MAIPRNLFVLIFFLFSACINSESIGYASNSNVEIISGDEKLEPNKEYLIGIKYRLDSGWHTYWKNPGDSGEKASFDWTLPEGYQIKGPYWPQPERIPYPPLMTFGYNDQVTVFFNLVTSETLKENNEVSLFTKWLACADVCLPQEANITINLSNNKSSSYSSAEIEDLFDRTIPKVFDKNISATYLKDKLILSFDLPEIHKTDSIVFFPNEYGLIDCLLYTSPSPRDVEESRMPSSA